MKRILFAIFISVGALNAQVEIHIDNSGPDVSGTIVDFNYSGADLPILSPAPFYVTNNTGADAQWQITRVKQNVPSGWADQLLWPPIAYPTYGDVYTTPSTIGNPAPIVTNGTNIMANYGALAIFQPQTQPNQSDDFALYMYYITDANGVYVDSVGLRYNYVLGVEGNTPALPISVAPNPANSYVNVKTNDIVGATVQIVDVLGNVVLKETVTGTSKTINTENFRNGVYFVRVRTGNLQPINQKLIIRH